jgi:ABC-type bacteriocin/lantibiotic exporter with double-glycine peptidase domain
LIAHRLSALRHCDAIYEMRNGCLERSGPASEIVIADTSVASMRAKRVS